MVDGALVDRRDGHPAPQVPADGVEVVVRGHQPQARRLRRGRHPQRGLEQPRAGADAAGLAVQREHLEPAVALVDGQQPDRAPVELGHDPFLLERVEQLAEARHAMVATLVITDQAARPVVVARLEVADLDRHRIPGQLPRYVLMPYGLSSSGTWYERSTSVTRRAIGRALEEGVGVVQVAAHVERELVVALAQGRAVQQVMDAAVGIGLELRDQLGLAVIGEAEDCDSDARGGVAAGEVEDVRADRGACASHGGLRYARA